MLVVMQIGSIKKFAKAVNPKDVALVESIKDSKNFVKPISPDDVTLVDNIEDCSRFDEMEEAYLADGLLHYCRSNLEGQFVCVPVTNAIFS